MIIIPVVALATVVTIFYGGYYFCPSLPVPASMDFTSKLIYTVRCIFPPLMVLQVAIMLVGTGRRTSKAINPLAGQDHLIQLQKNFLSNTLEQFIVFMVSILVLITFLNTPEEMRLVPLYTTTFIVGRILFRIGIWDQLEVPRMWNDDEFFLNGVHNWAYHLLYVHTRFHVRPGHHPSTLRDQPW